ncbi:hypothetical protein [Halothermothrix orenii]|uniref:Glutamate decarboxylase n=1 Tax=Halothermothrix orenii (strain H 168 / OCM 544 / DSM 9562) TaxID=373903 RepID=B8D1K2_HALOH|nr:hypothetical protein [Halothermothrix orenii]ACL69079.1 hypothetical protein Hore_03180 [Halothermothrix orenii H 168]
MWQVVHIATTEGEAKEIKDKLTAEGFLVKLESMSEGGFQIKVPEVEAEDVHQFLNDAL